MLCLRASDALSTPKPYCKSGNKAKKCCDPHILRSLEFLRSWTWIRKGVVCISQVTMIQQSCWRLALVAVENGPIALPCFAAHLAAW